MKKISILAVSFFAAVSAVFADFENVRVVTKTLDGKTSITTKALERQPDGAFRFSIPIRELTDNIDSIDVIGGFSKAKKGEEGYFVLPPNAIG